MIAVAIVPRGLSSGLRSVVPTGTSHIRAWSITITRNWAMGLRSGTKKFRPEHGEKFSGRGKFYRGSGEPCTEGTVKSF
jgi:hypothetical protein